jgi:hypothetical protein
MQTCGIGSKRSNHWRAHSSCNDNDGAAVWCRSVRDHCYRCACFAGRRLRQGQQATALSTSGLDSERCQTSETRIRKSSSFTTSTSHRYLRRPSSSYRPRQTGTYRYKLKMSCLAVVVVVTSSTTRLSLSLSLSLIFLISLSFVFDLYMIIITDTHSPGTVGGPPGE